MPTTKISFVTDLTSTHVMSPITSHGFAAMSTDLGLPRPGDSVMLSGLVAIVDRWDWDPPRSVHIWVTFRFLSDVERKNIWRKILDDPKWEVLTP